MGFMAIGHITHWPEYSRDSCLSAVQLPGLTLRGRASNVSPAFSLQRLRPEIRILPRQEWIHQVAVRGRLGIPGVPRAALGQLVSLCAHSTRPCRTNPIPIDDVVAGSLLQNAEHVQIAGSQLTAIGRDSIQHHYYAVVDEDSGGESPPLIYKVRLKHQRVTPVRHIAIEPPQGRLIKGCLYASLGATLSILGCVLTKFGTMPLYTAFLGAALTLPMTVLLIFLTSKEDKEREDHEASELAGDKAVGKQTVYGLPAVCRKLATVGLAVAAFLWAGTALTLVAQLARITMDIQAAEYAGISSETDVATLIMGFVELALILSNIGLLGTAARLSAAGRRESAWQLEGYTGLQGALDSPL